MEVVTERAPDRGRSGATCCSPGACASTCSSNAIVLAKDLATVGIGAGQMSRVDSVRLAVEKAAAPTAAGRRDGLRRVLPVRRRPRAGDRGRRHRVIQPGGSVRDDEVVAAADAAGVAMVFTAPPPLPPLVHRAPRLRPARPVGGAASATRASSARARHVCVAGLHRRPTSTASCRAVDAGRADRAGAAPTSQRRSSAVGASLGRRRADPHVRHRHRRAGRRSAARTARCSARSGRSPRWSR